MGNENAPTPLPEARSTTWQRERAEQAEAALADARHQQHLLTVFAENQRKEYEAEIARLRDALEEIRTHSVCCDARHVADKAIDAARKEGE